MARDSGSFRDPSGHVYTSSGHVYRTITSRAIDDFTRVESTGLLQELIDNNQLVPYRQSDKVFSLTDAPGVAKVLELEPLEFVSYPYEWSFAGLKLAALLQLDIHIRALEKGVTLGDASAYNVQFRGPRPVFIDHLSFRPYRQGEYWHGHRQFCEQYVYPLLLQAELGLPHNSWYRGTLEGIKASHLGPLLPFRSKLKPRILTHVVLPARFERKARKLGGENISRRLKEAGFPLSSYNGMLKSLRNWIENLSPANKHETVWKNYADANSYLDHEARGKHEFVADFANSVRPGTVWDIGCNTGDYSKTVLEAGGRLAIGLESDEGALERAFGRSVSENLNFLPLGIDVANPSPSQGWAQQERSGLDHRGPADAILALALLHHICIGRNVPLMDAVDYLIGLAPNGIIEFVPKNDPMVTELLRFREDIFDDYCEEAFTSAVERNARIVKSQVVTKTQRKLVWYSRQR